MTCYFQSQLESRIKIYESESEDEPVNRVPELNPHAASFVPIFQNETITPLRGINSSYLQATPIINSPVIPPFNNVQDNSFNPDVSTHVIIVSGRTKA